jgi:DNA-binding transcriptional MerR regulator
MRIGEVARRSRVRVDTVRYYEKRGILAHTARRLSGYRDFGPEAVDRIQFTKWAQHLGFTLEEVRRMLLVVEADPATCAQLRPAFEALLTRVDTQLAELGRVRKRLRMVLARCNAGSCTAVEELASRARPLR